MFTGRVPDLPLWPLEVAPEVAVSDGALLADVDDPVHGGDDDVGVRHGAADVEHAVRQSLLRVGPE